MLLRDVKVERWRNLEDQKVSLGPEFTVLFGRNGQGKSNFIEAVYYAIGWRSFRTNSNREMVKWGSERASVEMRLTLGEIERTVVVEIASGRRATRVDGKTARRDAESLRGASVIIFGPDDLRLPKGPAAERRRAVDRVVFGSYRPYIREAMAYETALKARNALLKSGSFSRDLLDSYDESLARTGARVVARRRETMRAMAPKFASAFDDIHGGVEGSIRYRSEDVVERAHSEPELEEAIRRGVRDMRERDLKRGFTGFGPHTDDLEFVLRERVAREHGSQGQIRSMVLAFKLAELRHLREVNRESPVLLLDDVTSELDEERRKRLFETVRLASCQTLITVTEREHLPELPGRKDWNVADGRIGVA